MNNRTGEFAVGLLFCAAVASLRLATAAPDFGGVSPDTGNYLLALQNFDPELARPHLPGSWLLVAGLRQLATVFGGYGALMFVAIACSAAAAGLSVGLFRRWFDATEAWALAAVVATQPVVWFFGVVPEIYAFDLFFAVLVARLGLTRRGLLLLPLVFALGVGLRPTTPVLLGPLYLWLWWEGRRWWRSRMVVGVHVAAVLLALIAVWPTLAAVGGPARYLELYRGHLTVDFSLVRNLWGISLFLATLAGTVLLLAVAGIATGRPWRPDLDRAAGRLMLAWLLPAGLFFVCVHYQKGYILLIVVPMLVLLAAAVARTWRRPVLVGLVALQSVYFLGAPYQRPDVAVHVAPAVRPLSLPAVWCQRVASTHLMAAARLRALAEANAELSAVLAATAGDTLLIDPTFPIFLRALQVRYPERAFAEMDLQRRDSWRLHAGLVERSGTGLADLIARSVLVTRADLAGAGLDTTGSVVVHRGPLFCAVHIHPGHATRVAAEYQGAFGRY